MFDKIRVGRLYKTFDEADELPGYSKVVISVDDELSYEAGTDSGRTLTIENPWGTQKMAYDILARVQKRHYKGYQATGVVLDPAAELGDAVTIRDAHVGLYQLETHFGGLMTGTIGAPVVEELDEETPYKSVTQRKIERQYAQMRATFQVQAGQIQAEVTARETLGAELRASLDIQAGLISSKVSKSGGDDSSFAWEHDDNKIVYKANGSEVFRIDASGAKVTGEIRATSGKIGGFDIQSDYLSYNGQTWGGTNSTGIYIGTNGIQCGPNARLTAQGELYAESGYFNGAVRAGSIDYGGSAGYLSGSGLSGGSVSGAKIAGSTLSTAKFTSGVNASLANADYAYGCLQGWTKITALTTGSLNTNDLTVENHQIDRKTIYYTNSSGGISSVKVLVWT